MLHEKIGAEIAAAMKARNASRLSALRMLKAAVMNKGVEKGRDLDDAEILQVVASLVKQRRDSIEQFANAGRTDLVEKETQELGVLQEYLPPAATADEIAALLHALVHDRGLEHAQRRQAYLVLGLHRRCYARVHLIVQRARHRFNPSRT